MILAAPNGVAGPVPHPVLPRLFAFGRAKVIDVQSYSLPSVQLTTNYIVAQSIFRNHTVWARSLDGSAVWSVGPPFTDSKPTPYMIRRDRFLVSLGLSGDDVDPEGFRLHERR
ncbi:hypothetical protein, partial [Mycolicibacterium mageritense]|uniref:hypothetical protein n=1 Tax=Mycolicibacterium mageritense TaxID=53462 RepID=UPI003B00B6C6